MEDSHVCFQLSNLGAGDDLACVTSSPDNNGHNDIDEGTGLCADCYGKG